MVRIVVGIRLCCYHCLRALAGTREYAAHVPQQIGLGSVSVVLHSLPPPGPGMIALRPVGLVRYSLDIRGVLLQLRGVPRSLECAFFLQTALDVVSPVIKVAAGPALRILPEAHPPARRPQIQDRSRIRPGAANLAVLRIVLERRNKALPVCTRGLAVRIRRRERHHVAGAVIRAGRDRLAARACTGRSQDRVSHLVFEDP